MRDAALVRGCGERGCWLRPAGPRLVECRSNGLDRRLDVRAADAVVRHRPNLSMGIFHHQATPRTKRREERGAIAGDLEHDEVRPDARWIEAPRGGVGHG